MASDFLEWLGKRGGGPHFASSGILQPGTRVGRWRVCAFLAAGGTSDVYRVEGDASSAALKIARDAGHPDIDGRFRREAELLGRLSPPFFPKLLDNGSRDGHPYLVTELLQPLELPRTDGESEKFVLHLAHALSRLHKLGFAHRDVKPTNILTRDGTTPVLVDLGYARPFSSTSPVTGQPALSVEQSHAFGVGTPGYAAPEQFTGDFVTPATDIHALGVLLNDCFKGAPPPAWRPLIRRATSSIPAQRYASIQGLATAVRRRHRVRDLLLGTTAVGLLLAGAACLLSGSARDVLRPPANANTARFCIVDLTPGPAATSYPVSYLDDIPADGWTEEHKTGKLVLRRLDAGEDPLGEYMLPDGFYIGVFEVTQSQWARVMGDAWRIHANTLPRANVAFDDVRGAHKGAQWPHAGEVEPDSFIGRLRTRTGLAGFDLPTVAQWKYACRAGVKTDYNTGCGPDTLADTGWYKGNSGGHAHEIGLKKPNAWGLYDMHGNVAEWCLDWAGSGKSTGESPVGPPYDMRGRRCKMGGAYSKDAHALRTETVYCSPSHLGFSDSGLRVALNNPSAR